MRPSVPPVTGKDEKRSPGVTLEEDEIKSRLLKGEIVKADLTSQEEERYREFVKMHKFARRNGDI
jgi:hypothetical protein